MEAQEKRNRRVGIWFSLGIHSAMFLILFFVMAWRAPDPPLPEFGIELNFGLDDQGSGDIQPEKPVGDEGVSEKAEAVDQPSEAVPEEVKEDSKVAEADKAVEQAVSKIESPVVVKEEKKETTEAKETKKADTTPAKVEATVPTTKQTATTEVPKKGDPGTQGDDAKKTGDKGSEQGKLDAAALYGTPGGGGGGTGMNLQMSGWAWADKPTLPELPDNESGRVEFEIECDGNGDITGITTLVRTLSPKAEQMLKDVIRNNSLVRTSGGKVPERSKGKIVFVLKTK